MDPMQIHQVLGCWLGLAGIAVLGCAMAEEPSDEQRAVALWESIEGFEDWTLAPCKNDEPVVFVSALPEEAVEIVVLLDPTLDEILALQRGDSEWFGARFDADGNLKATTTTSNPTTPDSACTTCHSNIDPVAGGD